MSLKITHKYSTAAGTPPASGDIDVGELAINAADAELYTKDNAGNIKKFANTDTTETYGNADGVHFTQAGTGAVQRTVESKLQDVVSVKDFGAVGDGVTDDTTAIQAAIDAGIASGAQVVFSAGTYKFSQINARQPGSLSLLAVGDVVLHSTKTSPNTSNYEADYAISLGGLFRAQVALSADAVIQEALLYVSNASVFTVGDLIEVKSTRLIQTDDRGQAREGQLCKVISVNTAANTLSIESPLEYFAPASIITSGTVQTVTSTTEFVLSSDFNLNERDARAKAVITSGTASGEFRYITSWDNTSKTAKFEGQQSPWPPTVSPGDSIEIRWETEVSRLEPLKLSINGSFHLTRDSHGDAIAGDLGFRGLVVTYADCAAVNGLTVSNFSEAGVVFRSCYKPTLENANTLNANRAYNGFDGTGYGVSIDQCWEALIRNVRTARCRKGIDVIGTQMVSWRTTIQDCQITGGGVSYVNNAFWPVGPQLNTGVGSHGAGYETKYINCTVSDVNIGFGIRGLGEAIVNCQHLGYGESCIRLFYGGGLTVDGFVYNDRFSEIGLSSTARYNVSSRPASRCLQFLEVYSDDYISTLPLVVKNVVAKKLKLAMIHYTRGSQANAVENLVVGNCVGFMSPEGTAGTECSFVRAEGIKDIKNLDDLGGNRILFDNGDYATFSIYDLVEDLIPQNGEYYRLSDTKYLACLDDDTAMTVPLPKTAKMALVSVFDRERDRNYRAVDMLLQIDRSTDASPLQASNKVGVNLYNTPLTGTTGADGGMNLAFKPNNERFLYIENRQGSQMRPIFCIEIVG